jgi:CBS domain-containing protein
MPRRARDLVKSEPVTVAPDTPFLVIQHLVVEAQVGGVVVVDDRGTVHGAISSIDLLRVIDQLCDDEIDEGEDADAETATLAGKLASLTAVDVLTPDPVWVAPDARASSVARMMRTEGISQVLVGADGHLVGMLTAFDLLETVA